MDFFVNDLHKFTNTTPHHTSSRRILQGDEWGHGTFVVSKRVMEQS